MIATKITWVQWPFEWCIQCRVWVHHNNLLRPNLPVCSSVYIWMTVNEIHLYLNNVGTETFRTRYRTTNFNVWWFSKTDLPPPQQTTESTILGHRRELKIIFSTYYYGPNIGVKVGLSNSIQSLSYNSHGRSALHSYEIPTKTYSRDQDHYLNSLIIVEAGAWKNYFELVLPEQFHWVKIHLYLLNQFVFSCLSE